MVSQNDLQHKQLVDADYQMASSNALPLDSHKSYDVFIAGSLGGAASVLVGQPLDTIKVKMQTFPELHPSFVKSFTKTLRSEGVFRGLYAGLTPALIATIPENAIAFCAYDYGNELVSHVTHRCGKERTIFDKSCAGFFAGFFTSSVLCPTELVKCRLQSARESNQSTATLKSVVNGILKSDGLLGFYKGLNATICREMPGYFMLFGGRATVKHLFEKHSTLNKFHSVTALLAGGVGGVCLWLVVFPMDLVKSRIQVGKSQRGTWLTLVNIVKFEGILSLYKGLAPTLLRTFPATAACNYVYETARPLISARKSFR